MKSARIVNLVGLQANMTTTRCWPSGLWLYIDPQVDNNVSKKHTVSISRAEEGDSMFLRNAGIYYKSTRRHNPQQ
jgi:hypothetical protein